MPRLLIVDDEANVLYSLQKALRSEEIAIVTADRGSRAIESVERDRPDAAILDVRLPDMSGLDVFERIRTLEPGLPVIIITAHATTETAIEAMKRGAFDYMLKPVDVHELRATVDKALEASRLRQVPAVLPDDPVQDRAADRIVGLSPSMQLVYKDIGRVAPMDVNVLVLGESGTGKELVARAIYHHSRRNEGPFLAINCAAIPESLLESELFGHERGAFTGADKKRIGKFENADRGTLFLDEIGDMSLATQAKILRLLQDGRFERIGGNETIQTDVRIIAATNKSLEAEIAEDRFREDLYYRLKVFSIELPPLRERKEDLPELVRHFLASFNLELDTHVDRLPDETMQVIAAYDWPGNVRELQGALKYAIVKAAGTVITPDCLPESIRRKGGARSAEHSALDLRESVRRRLRGNEPNLFHQVHDELDRLLLEEAMRAADGNQVRASKLLGISRTTLRAKLSQFDDASESGDSTDSAGS